MLDFTLSLAALIVLLPILLLLTVVGAIVMKGNPFFTQLRPGKDEKIFRLVKFRTMTCEKTKMEIFFRMKNVLRNMENYFDLHRWMNSLSYGIL